MHPVDPLPIASSVPTHMTYCIHSSSARDMAAYNSPSSFTFNGGKRTPALPCYTHLYWWAGEPP